MTPGEVAENLPRGPTLEFSRKFGERRENSTVTKVTGKVGHNELTGLIKYQLEPRALSSLPATTVWLFRLKITWRDKRKPDLRQCGEK